LALPKFKGKENIQKKHIKVVLLDLYVKHSADSTRYVSYYRMKGKYEGKGRYNKLHISFTTVAVVDLLEKLGYLEHHKGHYDRSGSRTSHMSRMRAKKKLIDLIDTKHHATPLMVGKAPNTECIILRDKDPKSGKQVDIPYKDTADTRRMRRDLYKYNNLLRRTFIDVPFFPAGGVTSRSGSKKINIDRCDKFVRRIFNNGSWDDGGRFYGGWWQRLPKDWREQIRIDGSAVIEVDYSGLHIVLLYAIEGIDYWKDVGKDPYEISGLEKSERMRGLLKLVLLTSINCKSKESAVKAVQYEINMDKEDEYEWVSEERIDLEDLINQFASTHKPINKYLFSGHGVKLQNIDATIAEYVINKLTKEEIPVLCIHDSFVVQREHGAKLHDLMQEGFREAVVKLSELSDDLLSRVKEISFWDRLWDNAVGETTPLKNIIAVSPFNIDSELIPKDSFRISNDNKRIKSKGLVQDIDQGDSEYQKRFDEHRSVVWEKEYYQQE